ncbi:hypothetical protein QEG73_18320 [Chitinophagaceae bacterium 26-R-25]|nr:hypothetical protein [Chitinophagaceae bacterium 26-R-25]
MENKHTPLAENDDEISLDSLLQTGRYLLAKCFYLLSLFFREIKRYWYVLLIGFLVGAGTTYFSHVQKEKDNWEGAEMLVINNVLPKNVYGQLLDNLNTVVSLHLTDQISKELKVDSNVAKSMITLRATNILGEPLWRDTSTKTNEVFKIIVGIKDAAIKDTLQSAILNYLNSNAYLAMIQKSKMDIARRRIALIDQDLEVLDSLKKASYKNASRSFRQGDSAGVSGLFLQSGILLDRKDAYQEYINTKEEPIMLIDGFKHGSSLSKTPLLPVLIKSILSGLVLGILCCLAIMFVKAARNFRDIGANQ